jgi:predicted XRE-type DNA-binding protein
MDFAQAIPGGRIVKKNKHIGSDFDAFLQEEGLLAEAEAIAVKRVIAHQIEVEMEERQISKSALARMMQTSRSSLNRLLDPENASVTLLTLESVALALGKKLKVQLG